MEQVNDNLLFGGYSRFLYFFINWSNQEAAINYMDRKQYSGQRRCDETFGMRIQIFESDSFSFELLFEL